LFEIAISVRPRIDVFHFLHEAETDAISNMECFLEQQMMNKVQKLIPISE
jgi:uncharacterized protein YbcV (DUF1398 family)